MNREFVERHFGRVIDLGSCILGQDLNVLVLRGFASLDRLAGISDADVFDMQTNPLGTQRNINAKHAKECLTYALDAVDQPAAETPRYFPEILLNAREVNVLELYNPQDPEHLFDFNSYDELDEVPIRIVGVRVNLAGYDWPKAQRSPRISRVDGNHRLFGVDEELAKVAAEGEMPDREYPSAAFALVLGLDIKTEARLFKDINGEHRGMETAHLTGLERRITDDREMRANPRLRPNWLAHELARPGRAFEGMVFMGGSQAGVREALGQVPPVKINALKSAITQQLQAASAFSTAFGSDPDAMLKMLDNYWSAVKETFSDAWADRRTYILLQSIGLNGFAKFGGQILDKALLEGKVDKQDFLHYLAPVKQVSLRRDDFEGIAGAGGARVVAEKLLDACVYLAVLGAAARTRLLGTAPGLDEQLRAAAPGQRES